MLNNLDVQKKRLIVVGGGAAGFFCAVNAARLHPALEVIILEKSSKVLSKVRISGGGRCNVTHACFDINEMVTKYPRGANFVKKAFHQFFTSDTIQWFKERQVQLKTESDGRMFPASNSSQTIIDCLLQEAATYNVKVLMNTEVKHVRLAPAVVNAELGDLDHANKKFVLEVHHFTNQTLAISHHTADFLCIASGGYPKVAMFEWLAATGHTIENPVPSLFTFNMAGNPITRLMGISVENVKVKISATKLETSGPVLITHWGLSGPAILKLSAWGARDLALKNYTFTAIINWLPVFNEHTLRQNFDNLRLELAALKMTNKSPFGLAHRLWEYFLQQANIKNDMRWADLPAPRQNKLIKILCLYECDIKGKTTFKEEFVTAGGIKLSEIDVRTMMSKQVPGLFFAGEVMDVDGITGGFNFQHAWTSAWIAAEAVAGMAEGAA